MNILAVIPARAGSKGIPGKNLKPINGVSLLARAIKTAGAVPEVTDIVVSTDGEDIKEEALKHGAQVPFMRPEELSSDTALSLDMWIHAWQEMEKHNNCTYDASVLLEPTSPMRTPADITACLNKLHGEQYDAVATFSPTPGHYKPHKTLKVNDQGFISFFLDDDDKDYSIRQNIPDYYHRNGLCYALRKETLFTHKSIIEKNCAPLIIDRPIVNVDEPLDLEWCEFLISKYGDPLQSKP